MKPKRTSDSYKNKSENSLGTEEIITLREFKNFILRGNVLDLAVARSIKQFEDERTRKYKEKVRAYLDGLSD